MAWLAEHTVFQTPWHLIATLAVVSLSSAIYGLFGFGSGLVAVGLLAFVLPVPTLVVLLLPLNLPVEAWVVGKSLRSVPWRRVALLLAGAMAAVPLGAHLLRWIDPALATVLLGGVLLVAGVAFLAVPDRGALRPWWPAELGVGGLSGLFGGMLGLGGPPVVLYLQLIQADKGLFRRSLLALFHVSSWVRVVAYAREGLWSREVLLSSATLLPAVAAGMTAGMLIHLDLSQAAFRRWVSVAFVLLGVLLSARAAIP